ncbi:DNA-binding transcriptional regulator, LacI/PurR family [Lachnospiraceae bacterium]|nr:DNA-binding transcriptional regulator, LacI/PurR family [Lachnospiraceae bacterium]
MGRRRTIGFVVSGIMDEFIEQLCRGIFSEATRDDVNIVTIPVKYIDREMKDIPDLFEYQYKTNIKNITENNLDVLIVAADCIGCLTTGEKLKAFMDELSSKNIPIILAAAKMDGYPGVIFDNKTGIKEGITYLVKDLGINNICMLKAPDHNEDASERYEAFLETADYYRLKIEPKNVVTTNLSSVCREDYEKILDMNPDAEAIFCANDDIAIGLYGVMKDRGLTPGKEIKVMGFDNSTNAGIITPSLTTVDADATHLGSRVFSMARMLLEGWDVGEMTIPTRFILRDSFGSLLDKENVDQRILDKQYLEEYFYRIFFKYDSFNKNSDPEIIITFKTVMTILIDYINDNEYNLERVGFVKKKVDEFFMKGALKYTDISVLLAYIDRVKIAAMNRFDGYARKCQAYETYSSIMGKIAGILHSNDEEFDNIKDESLFTLKHLVEDALAFNEYKDEHYEEIFKNLNYFGVNNAYLYIYDKPVSHRNGEDFRLPDTIRLKTAMTDGQIMTLPYEKQIISADNLFDNEYITDNKYNMVLMPLYFRETLYGSILYDLTDITYKSGEFLANQYALVARIIDRLHFYVPQPDMP